MTDRMQQSSVGMVVDNTHPVSLSPLLSAEAEPTVDKGTCNVCDHPIRRENTPHSPDWRCTEQHTRCTMIGCVPRAEAAGG